MPGPAAVGPVVHRAIGVGAEVARIPQHQLVHTALERPARHARAGDGVEHLGEQRDGVEVNQKSSPQSTTIRPAPDPPLTTTRRRTGSAAPCPLAPPAPGSRRSPAAARPFPAPRSRRLRTRGRAGRPSSTRPRRFSRQLAARHRHLQALQRRSRLALVATLQLGDDGRAVHRRLPPPCCSSSRRRAQPPHRIVEQAGGSSVKAAP